MPKSDNKKNVNYGGQAVIEGVMMRGTRMLAVAVRDPQGEIVVHSEALNPRIYGGRLAKTPFLRGLTMLWDALGLGIKSLTFSANIAMQEEGQQEEPNPFSGPTQWATVALSLVMAVALFFILPTLLARAVESVLGIGGSQLAENLIEGLIRLALLVGYIWAIGLMPDIKRLYGYHGAEHKTINAYEAGADLDPTTVSRFSVQHPRCGTAFLLTVIIVSILVFSLLPYESLLLRISLRLLLLPVVAGIAYEIIRLSAKHRDKTVVAWLSKPNLALQRLTTREPDETMLEVAITSLQTVLAAEAAVAEEEQAQASIDVLPEIAV